LIILTGQGEQASANSPFYTLSEVDVTTMICHLATIIAAALV